MRLPRRVAWAHIGELEQVCSWIYADDNDVDSKITAVNRLAAWKATTSLPHALESAHALLTVILEDTTLQGQRPSSSLALRQSYATAIIRLVNGLVDPLQLGAYARSINSIATQLGLPAWLVELRHAATHEDLPSIGVLREAASQAMSWLLQNYFLPTLNPAAPSSSQFRRSALRPLAPLLKHYKALSKATVRDASLATKYKHDMARLLREVERWVAEAKVAAPVATLVWEESDSDNGDVRERWALERLAEALLERGALVPASKKKRMLSPSTLHPTAFTLRTWMPLLAHLQSLHPGLAACLVNQITVHLISRDTLVGSSQRIEADMLPLDAEADKHRQDITYDRCVVGWANWLVDAYGSNLDTGDDDDDERGDLRRADVVAGLVTALGPAAADSVPRTRVEAGQELLRVLCKDHPSLERTAALASSVTVSAFSSTWGDNDMQLMQDRLVALISSTRSPHTRPSEDADMTEGEASVPASVPLLPPGWRLLTKADGWKPSPIGVFVACT